MIDVCRFEFKELLESTEQRLAECERELIKCPDGYLASRDVDNPKVVAPYKHCFKKGGKDASNAVGEDDPVMYALARKKYLQNEKRILESNISVLQHAMKNYKDPTPENVMQTLRRVYAGLPEKYFLPPFSRESLDWMLEPYERDMTYSQHNVIPTSLGIKVKSKSERDILEELLSFGLPTRSEEIIYSGPYKLAPDFTIKRPSDGELIYWEHFGRMDDPKYRSSFMWKLKEYEKMGIYPGKNLIITFEGDGQFLSIAEIHEIIKSKIL